MTKPEAEFAAGFAEMGPAEQAATSARHLAPISSALSLKYRCRKNPGAPPCRSWETSSSSS
eukprot:7725349-Pyramimonas_sp.AAC.1